MTRQPDAVKNEIESFIIAKRDVYFAAVHELIRNLPFIYIRASEKKVRGYKQPRFYQNDAQIKLPEASGVYLVYRTNEETPFYCGEADNLNNRVSFHFKDSPSVRNFSTLKKTLPELQRGLEEMSYCLRLRMVEVPFGRNDVEEYLHREYGINTKKRLSIGCTVRR